MVLQLGSENDANFWISSRQKKVLPKNFAYECRNILHADSEENWDSYEEFKASVDAKYTALDAGAPARAILQKVADDEKEITDNIAVEKAKNLKLAQLVEEKRRGAALEAQFLEFGGGVQVSPDPAAEGAVKRRRKALEAQLPEDPAAAEASPAPAAEDEPPADDPAEWVQTPQPKTGVE